MAVAAKMPTKLAFLGGSSIALGAILWHAARSQQPAQQKKSSSKAKAVVLGMGYCGTAIAEVLATELDMEVVGTTRGESLASNKGKALPNKVRSVAVDLEKDSDVNQLVTLISQSNLVVATAPPAAAGGDPFLQHPALEKALKEVKSPGLLLYLSSVGVYGDQQGQAVTEETPAAPRTARAKRRLEAEEAWRNLGQPLVVARLPGIYGPHRGPIAKAREGNTRIEKPGHVFSRIHVEDVALFCKVVASKVLSGASSDFFANAATVSVVNCCDSDPSPQHEVSALAYELLGRSVPPAVPFDSAELSAMQRSFYEESRLMVNTKLLSIVGDLKYPSYRTGLPASLREEEKLSGGSAGTPVTCRIAAALAAATSPLTRLARCLLLGGGGNTVHVALVDNGSLKAESTLSLRRLARQLEAKLAADMGAEAEAGRQRLCTYRVWPVSARFSNRIPPRELEGQPGELLGDCLNRLAALIGGGSWLNGSSGSIIILPLLIGPSSTLTSTLPQAAHAAVSAAAPSTVLDVEICPSLVCLCPMIYGASTTGAIALARILAESLAALSSNAEEENRNEVVFICDHGSPAKRVTDAREAVRVALEAELGHSVRACCMERREGPDYDFNGPLLEDALLALPPGTSARVALLFLQEGRHAGTGGDIDKIVAKACEQRTDLRIQTTKVLAYHQGLVTLLAERLKKPIPLRLLHE